MTDRDTIRQLVAEELARPEVQRELAERVTRSYAARVGAALRHPLAITVAGFVLTFFVGSQIESALAESRRDAQERARLVEVAKADEAAARQVIHDFVALVYERAVEAELLRSAIERASTPEILARKAAYDAAYREWNKREPAYRWALREVYAGGITDRLGANSPYEEAIAFAITRDFSRADACLTRAFDENIDAILPDREVANRPNVGCREDDWARHVTAMTERAKLCAAYIQVIGLIALRQRTEARIAAHLRGEVPVPEVIAAAAEVPEAFAAPCAFEEARDG